MIYENYYIEMNFKIEEGQAEKLSKFAFFGVTQNKSFTIFIVVLRYLLFVLSIVGCCFYFLNYK